MTCVVGMIKKNGDIIMGADSCGSDSWSKSVRKDPKIFTKGEMIFAFAGSFRMGNLLQYKLEIPKRPKKLKPVEYMNTLFIDAVRECLNKNGNSKIESNSEKLKGSFIVGYEGEIYSVYEDLQVGIESEKFSAMGSGTHFALGSMASTEGLLPERKRILLALQCAEKFAVGVSSPFKIMELKSTKNKEVK